MICVCFYDGGTLKLNWKWIWRSRNGTSHSWFTRHSLSSIHHGGSLSKSINVMVWKEISVNTVSHWSYAPLFRALILWQKCQNRTFSMIIYLLKFYLSGYSEKISNSLMQIFLLRQRQFWEKMHVQPERLHFLFAFCARHYPWWSLWQKNTKNNYFIQVNPFSGSWIQQHCYFFWRNALFVVISNTPRL